MEQYLLLWDRLGYRRGVLKKGVADDAQMWERLLPHARPIPPRTYLPGAKEAARLRGLQWELLENSGEVLVEGERVAIRWLHRNSDISRALGAHGWDVLFANPDLEDESPELVFLNRHFRTVDRVAGGILATGEHFDHRSARIPLAAWALSDTSIEHLRHCWELARALGLTHEFRDLLDEEQRQNLGKAFSDELKRAGETLAARHDARLGVFADGHDPDGIRLNWLPKALPNSTLEELWRQSRMLGHLHQEIGNQYYEDLCSDAALLLDEYGLADLLKQLPAGLAAFSGYDGLCRFCPRSLASLVWHPGTNVQGMFALTKLQNRIHFSDGQHIDLSDEWDRIQHLGRKLFLMGEQCNADEAIALGLDDYSQFLERSFWRRQVIRPAYWSREIWDMALCREEFSRATTDSLVALLSANTIQPTDTALLFALQQLERLRELKRPDQQKALAAALVSAYKQSVDVRTRAPKVASPLPAFGRLLAGLWQQLESEPELRATLIAPFDLDDLVSLGKQPTDENASRNYWYDVGRTFENHARFLLATASDVDTPEPILNAVVDLYLTSQKSGLPVLPFDWSSMDTERRHGAVPGVEPLFKRLAQQIVAADLEKIARRVLESKPSVHVLAAMRAGLHMASELRMEVDSALRSELDRRIGADDLVLGEVLDVAADLNMSGLGPEAQNCAEYAINLLSTLPGNLHDYLEEARLALALAHANQLDWQKVLALDIDGGNPGQHVFANNLRAAAHLELGDYLAAEKALMWVLDVDSENDMAVSNYCASLHRQARWTDLVSFVDSRIAGASKLLRERLLVLKAGALSEVGKSDDAALTLLAVGDGLTKHGDLSDLARKISSQAILFQSTSPVASPRLLYCEGGYDSIDRAFYAFLLSGTNVEIVPVGTHSDVQQAVQKWGTGSTESLKPRVAGVVDRDHYPKLRLEAFRKVVTVLPLNEVECALCHPNVVQLVARILQSSHPAADEILQSLQARAAELQDEVLVQRYQHLTKGTPTKQAEALRSCTSELTKAVAGSADELLELFPGKELLPAIKIFVGTDDPHTLLQALVQAGNEALQIEPLATFRSTLLRVLDL